MPVEIDKLIRKQSGADKILTMVLTSDIFFLDNDIVFYRFKLQE